MSMAKKIIKKGNIPTVTKTCEVVAVSLVLSVEMLSIILFAVVRVLWVENIILIALAAKRE